MLLNKLPVLDKGYVAMVSCSNNDARLGALSDEYFGAQEPEVLKTLGTLTLVIKCPLFVQLNLSKFDLTIITTSTKELEAYTPNPGEIASGAHDTDRAIADDLKRTTDALLINPRAYRTDGCDQFMSQILTPISIYTTLVVHGSYNEWHRYCEQEGLPAAIKAYPATVKEIMAAEWKENGQS